MRTLVVEDEETSWTILEDFLSDFGQCDVAVDGDKGLEKFRKAIDDGNPYDLICMDIMMPNMDGQKALREMRSIERDKRIRSGDKVKVIMTTALEDQKNVTEAFLRGGAASYIIKPVDKEKLLREVRKLGLID